MLKDKIVMSYQVTILGAGLAGCEAALWLAGKGVKVDLYEQKPTHFSPAHKSAGFAELICIHSLEENWHRGYGSMMMARVLADAKAAGYRNILLWVFDRNLPAIRFYRSHGFTPTGRKQPAFGAVEEMYVKTLDAQAAQAAL